MVICHCISGPMAGGAENLVKDLAKEQVKSGSKVVVFFLNRAVNVSRSQGYEQEYLKELKDNSVEILFPKSKSAPDIYSALRSLELHSINVSERIVIHCHLLKPLIVAALLPKAKFKVIYTHHSMNLKIPPFLYRALARRVEGFIGISNICAGLLRNATGRHVKVIYNAINQAKIRVKHPYMRPPGTPIKIMMVGSFRWEKNYEQLVAALALGNFTEDMLHIDIFGEGNEFNKIKNLILENNVNQLVTLKGNSSKIDEEYANYDIFLMCSVSEGLPISLIEASVAKLPVAVTDVGGCKEIVNLFENGIVLGGVDSSSLASSLEYIIRNFEELAATNAHIKDDVLSKFCIRHSSSEHIEFYKMV